MFVDIYSLPYVDSFVNSYIIYLQNLNVNTFVKKSFEMYTHMSSRVLTSASGHAIIISRTRVRFILSVGAM